MHHAYHKLHLARPPRDVYFELHWEQYVETEIIVSMLLKAFAICVEAGHLKD